MNKAGIEKSVGEMTRKMRHTNLDNVRRKVGHSARKAMRKKSKEIVSEVASTFGEKRRKRVKKRFRD
jgi:hypothetical protein